MLFRFVHSQIISHCERLLGALLIFAGRCSGAAASAACRLRAPAGVLLPVRPVFERCGPEFQQWRGLWRGTCRETYDKICRFKRQNLSLCETGISSAGAGFKHVRQSRPSMISTGGVGGESHRPGVGSAHALSAFAVRLSCAGRLASPSPPFLLACRACVSGSAGSRCRRPRPSVPCWVGASPGQRLTLSPLRPHVLMRSLSPARAGGWGWAPRLRASLLPCSLPPALLAAACAPRCRPAAPGWRLLRVGVRGA